MTAPHPPSALSRHAVPPVWLLLALLACGCGEARAGDTKTARLEPPASAASHHPVTIHRPYPSLGMNTGVETLPWGVASSPARAVPQLFSRVKCAMNVSYRLQGVLSNGCCQRQTIKNYA